MNRQKYIGIPSEKKTKNEWGIKWKEYKLSLIRSESITLTKFPCHVDDKRYILVDGIKTLAFGNKGINK